MTAEPSTEVEILEASPIYTDPLFARNFGKPNIMIPKHFAKGQKLAKKQKSSAPYALSKMYFIRSGVARFGAGPNGRLLQPNDVVVVMTTVQAAEEVIAVTDCDVLVIEEDDISALCRKYPTVELNALMLRLACQSENGRVVCQVLKLQAGRQIEDAERSGRSMNDGLALKLAIFTDFRQQALDSIRAPPPSAEKKKLGWFGRQ
jgi:CRP-like cAMP-binding protein